MVHFDGVTVQTDTISKSLQLTQDERKEKINRIATHAGLEAFAAVGSITSLGSLFAYRHSGWYRQFLGPSGKVLTALIPATMAYALVSEQVSTRLANPEAFASAVQSDVSTRSVLPWYQRTANWAYDHPVKALIYASVPTVSSVLYYQTRDPILTTSQKLMHSRVVGQFSVISILVLTMGFRDYMERNGRFGDEDVE